MNHGVGLRSFVRGLVYRTPLHRVLPADGAHRTQAYWDAELGGRLKPYLGGTLSIALRDAITVQLVRSAVPHATSLLDVGCAAGSMARPVRDAGIARYVGVDISRTAIDHADPSLGTFHVADLCTFDPAAAGPFDAVVFNEVLYYLGVDEAVAQVTRYAAAVAPGGAILFSLKDDAKSHAILRGIESRFTWETGVVWQERRDRAEHALRHDEARPAFLVGVIRAREGEAPR